jgi:hypothetical protein
LPSLLAQWQFLLVRKCCWATIRGSVINWVPVYNYTAGILTVFITAILIWRGSKLAGVAAITTFSLHTLVMILLQTVHRDVVAVDSIRAMTIRMIAWAIILVLMYAQSRKDKKAQRLTTVAKS